MLFLNASFACAIKLFHQVNFIHTITFSSFGEPFVSEPKCRESFVGERKCRESFVGEPKCREPFVSESKCREQFVVEPRFFLRLSRLVIFLPFWPVAHRAKVPPGAVV